ncbi:hypothetical protein C0991_000859 [Blastosporella zonata]|nr:hypothetical protein C0991_000859 [Blastosporella zonata]
MFNKDFRIYDALGEIIRDAKEFHETSMPFSKALTPKPLTRQIIAFHVHESATKAPRLNNQAISEGTVENFFHKFIEEGWLTKAAEEKKEIEIRLVCNESDLYHNIADLEAKAEEDSKKVSMTIHRDLEFAGSAKRRLSSASRLLSGRVSAPRNVRRSAWATTLKTTVFTWDLEMMQCNFQRTTATVKNNVVSFHSSPSTETLEIAQNWVDGWNKSKAGQNYEGSGYIGAGSAKRAIYARFEGREYALAQGKEGFDVAENKVMIRAEFENLIQGESLRKTFDDLGIEMNAVIPNFRFNLEHSILGTFIPSTEGDAKPPADLPYFDFIATPLLPSTAIDAPIMKFTGNDNTGDAPKPGDYLTMALHAFTHFTILYTHHNFVLCDLQDSDEAFQQPKLSLKKAHATGKRQPQSEALTREASSNSDDEPIFLGSGSSSVQSTTRKKFQMTEPVAESRPMRHGWPQ